MNLGVVITALNHAGTIIEATESVLSQSRLPDSLGLAIGPTMDGTDRMAEFYREEFDFIYFDRKIRTRDHGLMELRLGSLSETRADYLIFLTANSYLQPRTIERLERTLDQNRSDLVIGATDYLTSNGQRWTLDAPAGWTVESVLERGPIPPSVVLWSREALVDNFTVFQRMSLGAFSTTGWLLQLLDAECNAVMLDETFVETWDMAQGDFCWTLPVFDSLRSLTSFVEENQFGEKACHRLKATVRKIASQHNPPITIDHSEDVTVYPWGETVPLLPE